MDKTFRLLGKDAQKHNEDMYEIQQVLENLDNNIRKNNIRIKVLKEEAEGHDLKAFLEELFTGCLGSDSMVTINLLFAYRICYVGEKRERSSDVLVGFANWTMKAAVLDAL